MFCKNCGSQLAEGSTVCGNCGTPVDTPAAAPAAPEAAPAAPAETPAVPVTPEPAATEPVAAPAAPEAPAAPAAEPAAPAAAPVMGAPVAPNPFGTEAPAQSAAPEKKKLSKEALIGIIVGGVVLLAIIIAVVVLLTSGKGNTNGGNGNNGGDNGNGGTSQGGNNQTSSGTTTKTIGAYSVAVPNEFDLRYDVNEDNEVSMRFYFEDEAKDDLDFYLNIYTSSLKDYDDERISVGKKLMKEEYNAEEKTLQGLPFYVWTDNMKAETLDIRRIKAAYFSNDKIEYAADLQLDAMSELYTEGLETTLFEQYVPTIIKSMKRIK